MSTKFASDRGIVDRAVIVRLWHGNLSRFLPRVARYISSPVPLRCVSFQEIRFFYIFSPDSFYDLLFMHFRWVLPSLNMAVFQVSGVFPYTLDGSKQLGYFTLEPGASTTVS